jgi:Tfp pilus assembly protein PilV
MTKTLRDRARCRLGAATRADDGISIIEVLVAVVIFMILSVGVMQGLVTATRLAADQRHRVTALSLAASEIDYVRAITDPFTVLNREFDETIDGITYTVVRDTSWVSGTGTDIPCTGSGSDNLQLKRVNVTVSWTGRMSASLPVNSDTVLAPTGRINDPTLGTILISATRADGTGAAGVAVSITPSSGGAALDAPVPDTDSEGCSYALHVAPGIYTVTLSRSTWIDAQQQPSPTLSVEVASGSTTSAPFSYDAASVFALSYAPMEGRPETVRFASTNETTYLNTYGTYYVDGAASTVELFPWSAGYTPIAGHYVPPDADGTGGCRAVDPTEWPAATVSSVALGAGVQAVTVATAPGASAPMAVPMGIVEVTNVPDNLWVIAASVNGSSVAGTPTCTIAMRYDFATLSGSSTTNTRYLALPYGTWQLSTATDSTTSSLTAISASNISPYSNVVKTGMVTGNTVVVDPRPAE